MPKPKRRSKKGSVQIFNRNGLLTLRLSHDGNRHQRAIGLPDTPINRELARRKACEVELDIASGRFDPTFDKYFPTETTPIAPPTTLELWEQFIEHRRNSNTSEQAIGSRYRPIGSNLRRFGKNVQTEFTALEFVTLLRSKQSPRIANQNLSLLRGFGEWCLKELHWNANHFTAIASLKVGERTHDEIFEVEDIHRLIEAASKDKVLIQYRDFIIFLLNSGCRPSEAIGLRWEHVNFRRDEIHICESLSRSAQGGRIRKGTKSHSRFIPMSRAIRSMLEGRANGTNLEGLIFTSPTGKPIDDKNFCNRTWHRLCEKAGITYRSPYNCRHSVANHMLDDGATFHQVAYSLGNSARMISDTYGRKRQGAKLPEF
jgi:integrase